MEKVRYAELLPHEFRRRLKDRPVAYLPLGTIEWHGEHLPLGSDALQSEALMIACARELGGIVLPPIHLGPDRLQLLPDGRSLIGMDDADATVPHRQLDGSCYWVSNGLFEVLIDAILTQVKRAGFRAVFADGHGPSRWAWADHLAERQRRFGLKLIGVSRDEPGWRYMADHAARNETSIMLATHGALVDLAQLGTDRTVKPQGVGGADPRDASATEGEVYLREAVTWVKQKLAAAGV